MKNEMFIANLEIVWAFMVKLNCFTFEMLTFKQKKVQKVTILVTGQKYANFKHEHKFFTVTMLTNFVTE